MGNSLKERATLYERGTNSKFFKLLSEKSETLTTEQLAIMALICENMPESPSDSWLRHYVEMVTIAQSLMPSGTIRSRQILVLYALMTGDPS